LKPPDLNSHVTIWTSLHVVLWTFLAGLLLVLGAPVFYHEIRANKIGPIEPNHSIDNYLRGLTGVTNGEDRLQAMLERLPKDKPLMVFVRDENSQSEFLGMLVAYVSWPRQIRVVKSKAANVDSEVAQVSPAEVSGLVFCLMDAPRWLGKGIRFGSSIVIYPSDRAE
jgi:hypothetical protein